MKNLKAFLYLVMPLLIAVPASADSFSVQTWEQGLRASLNAGKTDLTPFFDLTKIEKGALAIPESADRKNMQAARELYAKGQFDAAIQKYNLIEKGSDYWLEALEEKAWAYHLENNFEKSLAQTKTLLAEPLVQVVGSEPFFLQSLSNLKICDYKSIFTTHQEFKDTQRERISAMETLAHTGVSPAIPNVITKADSFPLTFAQVGVEAKTLPLLFYRDLEVQKRLMQVKLTDRGIALIQERMTAANDADKAKLAKTVELLKKSNASGVTGLKNRLQALAKIEDQKNRLMLQKLGLIEVETIQRMHADKDMNRKDFSEGKFSKVDANQLVFPDDGRPWMDELDKYEVSTNACPRNVRRKM